jgi:hypothetical protein
MALRGKLNMSGGGFSKGFGAGFSVGNMPSTFTTGTDSNTGSTSGSYSYDMTLSQLVYAAGRKISAWAAGETPGSSEVTDFVTAANLMLKEWMASGIHVWTESEATLFLIPNQYTYNLGLNTTDHVCTSYIQTQAASLVASGSTSIPLISSAGLAVNNQIGLQLTSGIIQWTTISTIVGNTITIPAPGLSASMTPNAYQWSYATPINRPLRIVSTRRFYYPSLPNIQETEMIIMSRLDYRRLTNKSNTGIPTQVFYDPQIQSGLGILWVWPSPPDYTNFINFTWYRPIADFLNPNNIADCPQEWLNAIIWNLAVEMAPEYDVPTEVFSRVQQMAAQKLALVAGFDREPESVNFGVDWQGTF